MSGYRSIHREKIGSFPIWKIACSPILSKKRVNVAACWRVWLACGDGNVRGVLIIEKTAEQKDSLDAAACNCVLTHVLLGSSSLQQIDSSSIPSETLEQPDSDEEANPPCSVIGCSQLQLARNYIGDDDSAGSMIIASCDLSGKIRIWELPEGMDDELISKIDEISSSGSCSVDHTEIVKEFHVENATGTCIRIMPPNVSGVGDILIAVPCLDGTIALVSTGLSTPKSNKDAKEAGTIVDNWSKKKIHSIALNGEFHPKKNAFAVGRQDGLVEIYENSGERCHRLIQHEAPVRALSFAPDGNLLLTASDDGMLCVWDMSRKSVPNLVSHVMQAHSSWVVDITALHDARRFVSCGIDQKLHVWRAGEMDNQALHSFTSDESVWTIDTHTATNSNHHTVSSRPFQTRLVSGSENGKLHIYTLES